MWTVGRDRMRGQITRAGKYIKVLDLVRIHKAKMHLNANVFQQKRPTLNAERANKFALVKTDIVMKPAASKTNNFLVVAV